MAYFSFDCINWILLGCFWELVQNMTWYPPYIIIMANCSVFSQKERAWREIKTAWCQLPLSMTVFTGLIQDSHSSPQTMYLTHQNTQSQPFSCMNRPLSGWPLDQFSFQAWSHFSCQPVRLIGHALLNYFWNLAPFFLYALLIVP